MSVVLLRNKKAAEYPLLPQSVYDDFADPDVSVITMPKGRWQIADQLLLQRSDVTVNFSGCTLMSRVDPASFTPILLQSRSLTSPVYPPGDPLNGDAVSRTISHLHGTVVPSTTTLTMDADEVCDVQPGEVVLLWLGVDQGDPNEAQLLRPATVSSVDGLVITFAAQLGETINDFVDAAGLLAVVAPGQEGKIGDWGTYPLGGNFAKGYGTDHGMERFTGGGMTHNLTLNDPSLRVDRVTSLVDGSYALWELNTEAVSGVTVNRLRIHNPFSSATQWNHSFHVVVNGITLTGEGLGRIFQNPSTSCVALDIWGGEDFLFQDVEIRSTNTTLLGTEVGASGIVIHNLTYDVTFNAVRSWTVNGSICANACTWTGINHLNARLTGGANPGYFGHDIVFQGTLIFDGPFIEEFNWGNGLNLSLDGLVVIEGVTYGPSVTTTFDVIASVNPQGEQWDLPAGAFFQDIKVPIGLYQFVGVEIVTSGGLSDVEVAGQPFEAFADHAIVAEFPTWYEIPAHPPPPLAMPLYRAQYVRVKNDGPDPGLIRLHLTYLPEVV